MHNRLFNRPLPTFFTSGLLFFISGITLLLFLSANNPEEITTIRFTVKAPPTGNTQGVFISGNFNDWSPHNPKYKLAVMDDGSYAIRLAFAEGKSIEYKYVLGDWMFVEQDEAGNDIKNRQLTVGNENIEVTDEVARWRELDADGMIRPVSMPGEYRGYSEMRYDGWERFSKYIEARDGTRLAVDYLRPTRNGEITLKAYPVVWTHTRYHRAFEREGEIAAYAERDPGLQRLLRHGYIVASVDARGTGASFGHRRGDFSMAETLDAYDIIDWFAGQPWCNGNVGMYGGSYLGITQYLAAGTQHPALKAIVPEVSLFDLYDFVYPNGVMRLPFIEEWSKAVKALDLDIPAARVDADPDGSLRQQAMEEHRENIFPLDFVRLAEYRNSYIEQMNLRPFVDLNPQTHLKKIREANVPVYHIAGWYDAWPKDALIWYANLHQPQRLLIGPWAHNGWDPFERTSYFNFVSAERHRWFDYWLKGIDNGIMDEDPILYYTMNNPAEHAWNTSSNWPVEHAHHASFYFSEGVSNSINSQNDGILHSGLLPEDSGKDLLEPDYTASSGDKSRWTATHGGGFDYPDMTVNAKKGLTYTSAPLDEAVTITGHPLVNLWVSSMDRDFDLFVYLLDVEPDGFSRYITEGVINSRFRETQRPGFVNMGLPWRRGKSVDVSPSPVDSIFELNFDMHPTSYTFPKGHRIRLSITTADRHNAFTPAKENPFPIEIHFGEMRGSHISLPMVYEAGRGIVHWVFIGLAVVIGALMGLGYKKK